MTSPSTYGQSGVVNTLNGYDLGDLGQVSANQWLAAPGARSVATPTKNQPDEKPMSVSNPHVATASGKVEVISSEEWLGSPKCLAYERKVKTE